MDCQNRVTGPVSLQHLEQSGALESLGGLPSLWNTFGMFVCGVPARVAGRSQHGWGMHTARLAGLTLFYY